ncbi:MAG: chondroitinase family polysaccharide lyase [Bacteroidales bacterium]
MMNLRLKNLLCLVFPLTVSAQIIKHDRLLSFEGRELPSFVEAIHSEVSISDKHYKDGKSSLLWKFQPNGILSIKKELCFEKKDPTGVDKFLSVFMVWLYGETSAKGQLQFTFLKDGKVCCSFPFKLGFRGWRTGWIAYERDMVGVPEEGMNEIRITAPDTAGEIYIDHLLTAAKIDHRGPTADQQVPFINKKSNNPWISLAKHLETKPDISLESKVSDVQKENIRVIEDRMRELICPTTEVTQQTIQSLKSAYALYDITYKNGIVTGRPIYYGTAMANAVRRILPDWSGKQLVSGNMDAVCYFNLMNRIAVAYNNTSSPSHKDELKQMFITMYDHLTDQGWAYGSSLGTLALHGYSFRTFFTAYYLMKEVLHETGKQEEAGRIMRWYALCNEMFHAPKEEGDDADILNTLSVGRLTGILIMEDTPEKVQYLKCFSRWINNGCLPSKGLKEVFKKDGSAYHHRNHYPAYGIGALGGATNMIYLLHHTDFAVSPAAHQTVKNVLLTMRFYCNKQYLPLSMSGRHPNGEGILSPIHYATMACAGSPDGKNEVDDEMAGAYLRLVSEDFVNNRQERTLRDLLLEKGCRAESDPEGNIAMGYACISAQRRNNWSAVVRGHSRYLWAAEHYVGANRFGRYLAHGSLQIMTAPEGETVSSVTSGWQQDGFDWGRIPGTTAIHLPTDQLEANILNVDVFSGYEEMLYSDEAFAGGISQEHMNGAFGMKLHEHDKYNGTHRARKSFHFFDGKIVCLGTDIENKNTDYPTATTIFQLAVRDSAQQSYWNTYRVKDKIWIDHLGTGYYVPVAARFEKKFPQVSRKQNTGEETKGNWVSLVADHGYAPKDASYEYAVIPQTKISEMKAFAQKPAYKVLQKDCNAHIVKYLPDNITSYVLFETPRTALPKGLLLKADTSCLVMVREGKEKIILTVAQPDLALYRGTSDEAFDKDGKRIERSIYSRPWIDNESGEIPVTVTLKGYWQVEETPFCKIISSNKSQTTLRFICKDGASYEVELGQPH